MYKLVRPLLFIFNPESIHGIAIGFIKTLGKLPVVSHRLHKYFTVENKNLRKEVLGISFPNPVGFAAGFDKNARVYNELKTFGFGFAEIGTVTPKPQPGNPKPRCFRLPADKALINRMGFNNDGLEAVTRRLKKRNRNIILGGNIGKNTATPDEKAVDDYLECFKGLYDYVDYFTVNVSCPNVDNLRKLQTGGELETILKAIVEERRYRDAYKPVLLKISPDLTDEQTDDMLYIVRETGVDGIVAVNTTVTRKGLKTSERKIADAGKGGLGGAPLTERTLEVIKYIRDQTSGQIPIIGVGGIMTPEDAQRMLDAGASLIQIYTGYVYNGPGFVRQILKHIKIV